MKKLYSLSALLAVAYTAIFFLSAGHAQAFSQNNLIDDVIFNNANTMSASAIDNWLNTFPNSCISTNNGFSAPDVTGYSPSGPTDTGGFSYGSDVSAGTIIYHASQVYGLNPEVILTTLEKEESLVSGSGTQSNPACSNLRYSAAMGYLCTDSVSPHDYSGFELYSLHGVAVTGVTGTCVESAHVVGFSRQVTVAAWQLRFDEQRSEGNVGWNVQMTNYPYSGDTWDNSDDPETCYSHIMTSGYYQVCPNGPFATFDGKYTIDNTTVQIDNGATAALYNYTPHFEGNENFVTIFTNWFGSPTDYWADNDSSVAIYTDDTKSHPTNANILNANQRLWVVMSFRNNGSTIWSNSGSSPVRLATMSTDPSVFQDPSWINAYRPVTMDQSSVGPGGTATFSFWYTAPTVSHISDYATQFGLVAENTATMLGDQPTIYTRVFPPTYYTSNSSVNIYTDSSKSQTTNANVLGPYDKVWVVMSFRNNGSAIWKNSGAGAVHLATYDANDPFCYTSDTQSWINCARPATMDQSSVGPGGTATFSFWYKAPHVSNVSQYASRFLLVSEGVAPIIGDQPTIYTQVNPFYYADNDSSVTVYTDSSMSQTTNANTMTSGQRVYIVMEFRNNGSAIWSNEGIGALRLATSDANDLFCDTTDSPVWVNCARPATMQESSVGPGGDGTFAFWYKAPTVTHGSAYAVQFGLVAELVTGVTGDEPVIYTYVNPS